MPEPVPIEYATLFAKRRLNADGTLFEWTVELVRDNDITPLGVHPGALDNWPAIITNALGDLAASGWELLHVSEDRGLIQLTGFSSLTSGIVAARYLLGRRSG